jgi:hypothetical protein
VTTAWSGDDFISPANSCGAKPRDLELQIGDDELNTIPTAGRGHAPVGRPPTAGTRRAAQQQSEIATGHIRECRSGDRDDREPEIRGVEGDSLLDIVNDVANIDERHKRRLSSGEKIDQSLEMAIRASESKPTSLSSAKVRPRLK